MVMTGMTGMIWGIMIWYGLIWGVMAWYGNENDRDGGDT